MTPPEFDTLIRFVIFSLILFQAWLIKSNYREIVKLKEEIKEIRK